MNKLREEMLLHNLDAIDLEHLALKTGIENSYTKKVHARDLLVSFLLLINQDTVSLSAWASLFSQLSVACFEEQVGCHCLYERRRKRRNYLYAMQSEFP